MTNIADEAKSARTLDVTMVVGCYNHHSYIEQALDSVLAQSRRPAQLIITDDASSDGSQAVMSRWLSVNWPDAIFIKRNKNIGFPAILNEAMSLVSGDLVAVMSADDWMREDRIQLQAEAFESAEPNIGMVWSEAIES